MFGFGALLNAHASRATASQPVIAEGETRMAAKSFPIIDTNRSSKTGRFVTDDYAKKHPATTEHERIKRDTNKEVAVGRGA